MKSGISSLVETTVVLLIAITFVSNAMAGSEIWRECQNPNCAKNPPDPGIDGQTCSTSQFADVCLGFTEWNCGCKAEAGPTLTLGNWG